MLPLPLSPNATILLLTLGLALIYLELNRPGWILPGATGLLAVLLTFASIAKSNHPVLPAVVLLLAFFFLYSDDRRPSVLTVSLAGFLLLAGFYRLTPHPPMSTRLIAVLCAGIIALNTHLLNRIAYQARVNKGTVKTGKLGPKRLD